MLRPDLDVVRLWLHVVGACVWIGGQIALATLVPVLRRTATPAVVRAVARQFQRIAWPAFAVLLITGVWNLLDVRIGDQAGPYLGSVVAKLVFVVVSGVGAAAHALAAGPAVAKTMDAQLIRRRQAISGATAALGLLSALAAAFVGIQL